jgi:manganese efflux pump family protein
MPVRPAACRSLVLISRCGARLRDRMSVIALATWITAAAGGMYLLSIWLIEYDKDFQAAAATRLPPAVLAGHVLLAVGGLIVWAAYLFFDDDDLTWIAVAALGLAAVLGLVMAVRWFGVYRGGRPGRAGDAQPGAGRAQNGTAGRTQLRLVAGSHRAGTMPGDPGRSGPDLPGLFPAWPGEPGQGEPGLRPAGPGRPRPELGPPERNFPLPVVIAHGLFAFVTLALVLLVAFGVEGS